MQSENKKIILKLNVDKTNSIVRPKITGVE